MKGKAVAECPLYTDEELFSKVGTKGSPAHIPCYNRCVRRIRSAQVYKIPYTTGCIRSLIQQVYKIRAALACRSMRALILATVATIVITTILAGLTHSASLRLNCAPSLVQQSLLCRLRGW
jgi:hypothetical protein